MANIIVFKNGLGRSDAAHIKYSLGFNYFLISYLTLYLFLKKYIFNPKYNSVYFVVGFTIVFFQLFYLNKDNSSLKNLKSYKINVENYVSLEDAYFLDEEKKIFLKKYSNQLNKQDCEINITNEPAWSYLLRKKTCSKFYVSWFAASDELQEDYINILKEKKINMILFESKFQLLPDGLHNKQRIKKILDFLEKNYSISDHGNFKIAKLKE